MPFWILACTEVSWRTGLAMVEAAVMKATNWPVVIWSRNSGDSDTQISSPMENATMMWTTGVLTACGLYLILRGRTFPVVVGLTLLSYAVNLFLFSMGGLTTDGAAILNGPADYADPLPQALVLTAIVIGFAMTAFVVILAMRARSEAGNDHVDGRKREEGEGRP